MEEQNQPTPSSWEQGVLQSVLMASIKEQRSARRWGIFFKGAFLAYFLVILFLAWPTGGKKFEHHAPHAAMVTVNGMISAADEANAKSISEGLRNAFEAEKSKGVIVKINSPGGSPVQSSYIYNEMRRLRAKYPEKKLYAVIEDLGGSGGYFVAVGADEIYADPASIVGSIGVLMPNFGFVEIMQKIGVEQRTLAAGENKNFLDPLSPVKPEQVAFMKNLLEGVHQQFIKAVKEGRGQRLKSNDPTLFSGLFWSGEQALTLGLIDGFGSAEQVARDIIGEDEIVDYTMDQSFFERLSHRMGSMLGRSFKAALFNEPPVMMQ